MERDRNLEKGRSLRIQRITQDKKAIDVSRAVGISPSKLCYIERGYCEVSDEMYDKLAKIINQK